jgi:protein TonB
MFEQSILAVPPTKRTWSLAISLAAQTAFIVAAGLLPLIYTDQLPGLAKWAQNIVAPSPPPAPLPVKETPPVTQQAAKLRPVFTAPTTIPHQVALVDEPTPLESVSQEVVGATGPPGPANAITQLITNMVAAPRPLEPPPVKPSETATGAPTRVSAGIQEAKLLKKVIPTYPPLAITTRTQGTVHLIGVIAKDGTIRDLQVIDGHPLLVRAAVEAVKQWVYKPTLLSGEPVEVVAPIIVTFTLNR